MAVGRPADAPTLIYRAGERRWRFWWPCDRCGGTVLPLRDRVEDGNGAHIPSPFNEIHGERCPGCDSRCRRVEPARAEPSVWFDTMLGDWVVRLPCHGLRGGAILPLEIPWFDAPWSEVYRAAGDVAYGSDALRHSMSDELPEVRRRRDADGSS